MIFGVLGKVAKRARIGDRLDNPRALDLLAPLELFLERRIALDRQRHLFHRSSRSKSTCEAAVAGALTQVNENFPEASQFHRSPVLQAK